MFECGVIVCLGVEMEASLLVTRYWLLVARFSLLAVQF